MSFRGRQIISQLRVPTCLVLTLLVIQHSTHAFMSKLISPPLLNIFPEHALAVDKIETGSKYPNFETIDKELYRALAD